jgi:hypothetical protein
MAKTYKAVEVSAPGVLRVVERAIPPPGPGQVRIRVEACGICHTDSATVTGTYPGLKLPRVPGHEVVGRIEAGRGSVQMENRSAGWCRLDPRGKRVCEPQRMGGARAILATAPSGDGMGPLVSGLAAHGKLIKWLGRFQVRRQLVIYSNSSTTISGFDPSRRGGPHVPAPLEVKTCMFPIRLKPYTNCR